MMVKIQVKEFEKRIADLIADVENGETFMLMKNKTPIAEIVPLFQKEKGWKRDVKKADLPGGISTMDVLREERNS